MQRLHHLLDLLEQGLPGLDKNELLLTCLQGSSTFTTYLDDTLPLIDTFDLGDYLAACGEFLLN